MNSALAVGSSDLRSAKLSSGSVEHFTPRGIIDAAREVLKVIELDPASCELANKYVQARRFFDREDDGFKQNWQGRTFLNPPGGLVDALGRPVLRGKRGQPGCTETGECGQPAPHKHRDVTSSAVAWWRKLAKHWADFDVEAAIFVGFTVEILQSSQVNAPDGVPLPIDFPLCFPSSRLEFLQVGEDGQAIPGESPTHANVIVYLPPRFDPRCREFERVFSKFGKVRL